MPAEEASPAARRAKEGGGSVSSRNMFICVEGDSLNIFFLARMLLHMLRNIFLTYMHGGGQIILNCFGLYMVLYFLYIFKHHRALPKWVKWT